jgi:CBS domain-containing protein
MRVRELMTPDPEACLPTESCAAAGAIMARRRCGYVPVVDSQAARRVVGVVTDRDLALHLVRTDRPASQAPVEACMTRKPKTVGPDAELEEAATLMESLAVHRLPVVEGGRLVGVLSLKDIARQARKQWARSGPNVPERQMTEILEAIAAARAA